MRFQRTNFHSALFSLLCGLVPGHSGAAWHAAPCMGYAVASASITTTARKTRIRYRISSKHPARFRSSPRTSPNFDVNIPLPTSKIGLENCVYTTKNRLLELHENTTGLSSLHFQRCACNWLAENEVAQDLVGFYQSIRLLQNESARLVIRMQIRFNQVKGVY